MTPHQREVAELNSDGATLADISKQMGISENAVRAAQRRAGVQTNREDGKSIRALAEDMKPLDAVDYLLGVIEQLDLVKPCDSHEIYSWGIRFTKLEMRILRALYDAGGVMTYDAIYAGVYYDRADADDLPDLKIVNVMVSKINKKIPPRIGRIKVSWGIGYFWEPAA